MMQKIKGWYANIGKKIKGLAIGLFVIEAIVSVISACALSIAYLIEFDFEFEGVLMTLIVIIAALVVMFIALISTWTLYAFGELVDNSFIIAKNTVLDKGEGVPNVESLEKH